MKFVALIVVALGVSACGFDAPSGAANPETGRVGFERVFDLSDALIAALPRDIPGDSVFFNNGDSCYWYLVAGQYHKLPESLCLVY